LPALLASLKRYWCPPRAADPAVPDGWRQVERQKTSPIKGFAPYHDEQYVASNLSAGQCVDWLFRKNFLRRARAGGRGLASRTFLAADAAKMPTG